MSTQYVIVPQSDLDAVEKARVELYELLKEHLKKQNDPCSMFHHRLTNITHPLWFVGNKRYPQATSSNLKMLLPGDD